MRKGARFHVFIGTDFTWESKQAYEVTKFSIESQTELTINFFPILIKNRLSIPRFCKKNNLKGIALYIEAGMLFKADINELFELISVNNAFWCVKHPNRMLWHTFMTFNLDFKCVYKLIPESSWKWKDYYKDTFGFISRKQAEVDFELGEIPREWNIFVDDEHSVEELNSAKCLNFTRTQPWLHKKSFMSKTWYNEYKLFIINSLLPEIKNLSV